jgi:signal transduction histidine kinase
VGIALLKGQADKEAAGSGAYLTAAIEVLERSLAQIRTVAANPTPSRHRRVDLRSALSQEARLIGTDLSFESYGDESWLADDELELILLAGREAIRNVMRHSASTRCQVTLDLSDCPVYFRVRDWGTGLVGAVPDGDGLRRLRDLAASMRWQLDIKSLPGLGTELMLVGRPCPGADQGRDGVHGLRSVVAEESISSRKRVGERRPIGPSGQQIS